MIEQVLNWIFAHLQIVLVVATAIAVWAGKMREARAEKHRQSRADRRGDAHQPPVMRRVADEVPDLARDLQEEIRRKILERRADREGRPSFEPRQPPPLHPEPAASAPRELPKLLRDRLERKLAEARLREESAAEAARRRRLAAEARAHEAEDEEEARRRAARQTVSSPAFSTAAPAAHPLVAALRDPASTRRAVILREILGPPVALR